MSQQPVSGDVGYASSFAGRLRSSSTHVRSPRTTSATSRRHNEASGWNKSVRVGKSATRSKASQTPPSSPTARRFHSPNVLSLSGSAADVHGGASSQVEPLVVAATGPSAQARSLLLSAQELAGSSSGPVLNVAATVASTPRTVNSQAALVQQLRDVVLKLSQGAVEETQEAVNTQKRFDAYTELVREQDRVINELRSENTRLQRERDTLLEFRHQNLQRDMKLLSGTSEENASLTKTPLLDELIQMEFAKSNGLRQPLSVASLNDAMTPQMRNLARSLAAQLYDERTRRLDVEEKSSILVGQQQSVIDTLEQRLRRAERSSQHSPRMSAYAYSAGRAPSTTPRAMANETAAPTNGVTTPSRGELDSPTLSSYSATSSDASPTGAPVEARRYSNPMTSAQRRVAGQLARDLESPQHAGSAGRGSRMQMTPPLSPRSDRVYYGSRTPADRLLPSAKKDSASMSPSEAYDDASVILSAIRQKYGL